VVLGVFLLGSSGKAEIVDRIVAIVNENIITLSELEQFRKSFYPYTPKRKDWLNREFELLDVRQEALNTLIEEKLIDQEADRQKIEVTQKQLNDTVASLKAERGWSQSQLEMAVEAQGFTYEEYLAEVERRLKRTKLITRVVKSEIEINDENLRAYYEAHIDDYMADESIRISHILLPLAPNSTSDAEEAAFSKAREILARLEEGEDLTALARQYSQDILGLRAGDIGYFKQGEMIPSIEEAAFSLRVGEVTAPIRTPEGVVLIKVTDRQRGGPPALEEIRKRVENDYYRSETERRFRDWVNRLKERSFIEVKL
jgi:peptidyl-prolyl cis-trans isomerase SurA